MNDNNLLRAAANITDVPLLKQQLKEYSIRCVAELERQQQQVQGSQESESPYSHSLQKSGGSIPEDKSHDALGMNINDYADVSD